MSNIGCVPESLFNEFALALPADKKLLDDAMLPGVVADVSMIKFANLFYFSALNLRVKNPQIQYYLISISTRSFHFYLTTGRGLARQ